MTKISKKDQEQALNTIDELMGRVEDMIEFSEVLYTELEFLYLKFKCLNGSASANELEYLKSLEASQEIDLPDLDPDTPSTPQNVNKSKLN